LAFRTISSEASLSHGNVVLVAGGPCGRDLDIDQHGPAGLAAPAAAPQAAGPVNVFAPREK